MGNVELPFWGDLLLFMLGVLVVSAFVITAAGQFPREHRNPTLTGAPGGILLWSTIAIATVAGVAVPVFAWLLIPWYAAVIGGGLMILIAPYVLHPVPNRIINGVSPLVVLAGLAMLVGGGMWWSLAERL